MCVRRTLTSMSYDHTPVANSLTVGGGTAVLADFGKPVVFLDMDGVLADFHKGAARMHGIAPKRLLNTWPRGKFFLDHEDLAESRFKRPNDADPLMGVINRRGGQQFWENLEPTPWFSSLYSGLRELGQVEILTTPSIDPNSLTGKIAWLERHALPHPTRIHFSSEKEKYAHPRAILVDDGDHNVRGFRAQGGHAVLVPQPWNSAHHERIAPRDMADYLLNQVERVTRRLRG